VIFLDIAMPEVDGFDVARHLPLPRPLIVFQTAYSEFALKAFDHEAIDYVVKPVSRERLAQAVERAERRIANASPDRWTPAALGRVGEAIGHVPGLPARLLVREGAAHRLVPLNEIVRFTAEDGLVYAHTAAGVRGTDYTLATPDGRIRPREPLRAGKSRQGHGHRQQRRRIGDAHPCGW
jgi:two-component system LytT family response regulator